MGALDFLGGVTAPTRQIAAEVHAHLERNGTPLPTYPDMKSQVIWGYNAGGAEHGTGRALDFMVRNSPSVGDEVADYVWANRERFGLIHIIWRQRIRSTRVAPIGSWRHMADRGSPTENHMDHLHCFFDGRAIKGTPATGASSAWTPTGELSTKGIQELVGVTQDGDYGPATTSAVKNLQQALNLIADGLWGPTTEGAVMSLIEKIDAIAKDVKELKTEQKRIPARVWAHRISTPGSVKSEFGSVNPAYSAGGLLAYNLIDFYLKGRSDKIMQALEELES